MKSGWTRWLPGIAALVLPSVLARMVLNAFGHRIGRKARIGFSLVLADRIIMQPGTRIGHLNFVNIRRIVMRQGAYLGRRNLLYGPLSLWLDERAALGNGNKVVRGPRGSVVVGPACLKLGKLSKITADHRVDCTRSVSLGDYTTVAGVGTRIWTHGYVHELEGPGRYRVDGTIKIGSNVYVGAGCTLSMGIRIASGVMVGAGVTVARDLEEVGLYVSAALRMIPRPSDPDLRETLESITAEGLQERVYLKRPY